MRLVRLEPSAPRSRVKHSTTEPLCSLCDEIINSFENSMKPDMYSSIENSVDPDQLAKQDLYCFPHSM